MPRRRNKIAERVPGSYELIDEEKEIKKEGLAMWCLAKGLTVSEAHEVFEYLLGKGWA